MCCEFGLGGVEKNNSRAEEIYLDSAARGCWVAISRLAFLKTHGRPGILIDLEQGRKWSELLQDANKVQARRTWLHWAAEENMPVAQYCLALQYYNAIGTEVNKDMAFEWCFKAATQGLAPAQNLLGNLYVEGTPSNPPNPDRGMFWYIKAGEQYESTSIYNIGTLFERGIGVERNLETAIDWYLRAAAFDSSNAHNVLGTLHEQGVVRDASPAMAVYHYRQAVNQGHCHATYNLARALHDGFGCDKDMAQAYVYFVSSARQGHDYSQFSLAICYEWGMGVERNWELARKWYARAAKNGVEAAQLRLFPMVTKDIVNACNALMINAQTLRGLYSLPIEIRLSIIHELNHEEILSKKDVLELVNEMMSGQTLSNTIHHGMETTIAKAVRKYCSCAGKKCQRLSHVVFALRSLETE
ncbi:hypothetical protein HDV03_003661 [Kappamyces sp. JEL0829]|nr:hypothetical protein HDV03_003661 [Kappamyces sp. JEL0829]